MPILPLPQFEADLAEADREAYERLKPPTSIVVRFGAMRLVGEYPYDGDAKPGCGSKLVVRTHRGAELGEMLTSTCPNAGCGKSVSRKQMLEYIENSGGKDYPFFTEGRVLRIATIEDMNAQARLEASAPDLVRQAREETAALALDMKIIEAEPILGGEKITFYFTAPDRVDFRELARRLAHRFQTRIELRQVGARDEARLTADYERCGQHCCCKQFLKVLKPVSMKAAKVQKATLDPMKISGRCGRLMCCLRYEDETYDALKKRLPRNKTRVGTPEGPGIVIDSQILTQLVLVALERVDRRVAVPVEELSDPDAAPPPKEPDPLRGAAPARVERRAQPGGPGERSREQQQDAYRDRAQRERRPQRGARADGRAGPRTDRPNPADAKPSTPRPPRDAGAPASPPGSPPEGAPQASGAPGEGKKRRRKRRRGSGGGQGGGTQGSGGGGDSPPQPPSEG